MSKVILVSRSKADATKQSRMIVNQNDLVAALTEKFGERFELFRPSSHSIEAATELFEQAVLVIGSHGGGMYHALWAHRSAVGVEIMPVNGDGAYPEQGALSSMPPFAHLAIYTNSMMNGQRFYRWYQISRELNYRVNVSGFMNWLKGIDLPQGRRE
jgi:hypothetical protein